MAEQIRDALFLNLMRLSVGVEHTAEMNLDTARTLTTLCEDGALERCMNTARNNPDWEGYKPRAQNPNPAG